ncbi:energy-coupling factor transporter transmembrane protein EcfT [Candidatus Woesebacteria bacterium]|nr:energy-coupling factor transporter transmembrane protein EcfT [Candidatus Woesebacteria bacterium]
MNNLKTWLGILLLLIINILILDTKDLYLLSPIFTFIYLYGYLTQSKRKTVQRIRAFVYIGISLLFFQIVFNQSVSMVERISAALRVTLQIASISQIVFLFVQHISPSALISALGFLPRTWQLLLAMTFTFIPVLVQEQDAIQMAQKSRGFGLTWKSKFIAPFAFFVPLMHRILQRSEAIGLTMVSRGFVEE